MCDRLGRFAGFRVSYEYEYVDRSGAVFCRIVAVVKPRFHVLAWSQFNNFTILSVT